LTIENDNNFYLMFCLDKKSNALFMIRVFTGLILVLAFVGCKHSTNNAGLEKLCRNQLQEWNGKLTEVIITDVLTPPVCSRIYAYTNIAAYEALVPSDSSGAYPSFAGRLNGLNAVPQPTKNIRYCYPIASVIAFTTVAQKLVFNGDAIEEMEKKYLQELDSLNIEKVLLDSSVAYGRKVGNHIIGWAGKDGYLQRTSFPGYIVTKKPGRWIPTPPDYMDAVEVNWSRIRPFALDSASQFRPPAPIKFDTARSSPFFKQAYEVYTIVKSGTPADSATAWYWDDNPNTSITQGHVTYFQQKMSPPGHWVLIACNATAKENCSAVKTASIVSQTAISIADAIISCWETKYFYNYIRPESYVNAYIRKYIDRDWVPLIQTPPFPEYTSAHSCLSAGAATVLTNLVGDNYTFIDSTEVPYGRPQRKFNSFQEAATQASYSRMYGGIHFREALETGNKQGRQVGKFVTGRLGVK
jgi:hypothetical protein